MPESLLLSLPGTRVMWVEGGVAVALSVAAVLFHLLLGKLIKQEKLLP